MGYFRICFLLLAVIFVGCSKNDGKTTSEKAQTRNILQTLWHEATDQFDPDATYKKGQKYEYGDGVPQSVNEAVKWYKKSYHLGNAKAGIALALIYKTDSNLRNEVEAGIILKKLSEEGNQDAKRLYESHQNKANRSTDK